MTASAWLTPDGSLRVCNGAVLVSEDPCPTVCGGGEEPPPPIDPQCCNVLISASVGSVRCVASTYSRLYVTGTVSQGGSYSYQSTGPPPVSQITPEFSHDFVIDTSVPMNNLSPGATGCYVASVTTPIAYQADRVEGSQTTGTQAINIVSTPPAIRTLWRKTDGPALVNAPFTIRMSGSGTGGYWSLLGTQSGGSPYGIGSELMYATTHSDYAGDQSYLAFPGYTIVESACGSIIDITASGSKTTHDVTNISGEIQTRDAAFSFTLSLRFQLWPAYNCATGLIVGTKPAGALFDAPASIRVAPPELLAAIQSPDPRIAAAAEAQIRAMGIPCCG